MSQTQPSAFKAWLAVFSVALGAFIVVTSEFLPIGLLTQIARTLQVTDGTAGLMITIPGLVAAVAAPMMTIAAGHLDRRHVVLGLIGLLLVSNLTAAFAPSFAVMIVARVLFGITLGGFWTIAVTLGGRLVPKESLARATTIILAGISVATVLGVPLGTVVAELSGWRASFAVMGGLALLIGIVQLFVLPSLPPPPAPGLSQLTHLLRHADARLGLITVAFVVSGHFAAYTYVAPFLRDGSGISSTALSTLLLAYGGAGVLGNFAGGALAARNLRVTLIGVVCLQAGAILLLPVFGHHLAGAAALLVAWGLAFGAVPIVLQLWVFKAAPEALEGGAALLVTTFQVVIATGSVVGGRIVDHFGTSAVMWSGGATTLLALIIVALTRPTPNATAPAAQAHLA